MFRNFTYHLKQKKKKNNQAFPLRFHKKIVYLTLNPYESVFDEKKIVFAQKAVIVTVAHYLNIYLCKRMHFG